MSILRISFQPHTTLQKLGQILGRSLEALPLRPANASAIAAFDFEDLYQSLLREKPDEITLPESTGA